MKILFDGGSSYIALWIIKELTESGHEVTATFRKRPEEYEGLKQERLKKVQELCKTIFEVSFGDEKFMKVVRSSDWDLFCHHAAEASNPRDPEFNWLGATQSNTKNLSVVIDELKKKNCNHIIITGSLYEADEGCGDKPIDACNPYGLSKSLTWQAFRYFCQAKKINLGKFVIPICFGPYEDPKFHSYLAQSWLKGETPTVKTPKYTRDDTPVTLIAKVYNQFAEGFVSKNENMKINPSCYVYVREEFAKKFALEMKSRLGIPCPVDFANQTEFPEPMVKVNSTKLDWVKLDWDEKTFWDELAKFYLDHYSK